MGPGDDAGGAHVDGVLWVGWRGEGTWAFEVLDDGGLEVHVVEDGKDARGIEVGRTSTMSRLSRAEGECWSERGTADVWGKNGWWKSMMSGNNGFLGSMATVCPIFAH